MSIEITSDEPCHGGLPCPRDGSGPGRFCVVRTESALSKRFFGGGRLVLWGIVGFCFFGFFFGGGRS